MGAAVALGAGAVLAVLWVLATRRHVDARDATPGEWEAGDERPDLWTSSARCIHCGASGGLLELAGNEVLFACLVCGRRHARSTRA